MTGAEAIDLFNIRYEFMGSQNAPGYTDDEILDILNYAQYRFISQRLSGNNIYRTGFNDTTKRVDDLHELIELFMTTEAVVTTIEYNVKSFNLPANYLHFVRCTVGVVAPIINSFEADLITSGDISSYLQTPVNTPWIETPKVFVEAGALRVVYDRTDYELSDHEISLFYIRKPATITSSLTITDFNEDTIREIIEIAVNIAIADGVPEKVQISNDQLNKIE